MNQSIGYATHKHDLHLIFSNQLKPQLQRKWLSDDRQMLESHCTELTAYS